MKGHRREDARQRGGIQRSAENRREGKGHRWSWQRAFPAGSMAAGGQEEARLALCAAWAATGLEFGEELEHRVKPAANICW